MSTAKVKTFLEQIRLGKVKNHKQMIFSYIRKNPGCIEREISRVLGVPLQTVSARCAELKDMGVVYSISQQNYNGSTFEVLLPEEDILKIADNQRKRKRSKWKAWLKKARDFREFMTDELQVAINVSESNAA